MVTILFNGGWGQRAASYDEILKASRRMLTSMPDHPAGAWTRFIPREDSVFMDAVPVDINDPASLATAIESTSRRGDRHRLDINRQAGPEDYPVLVRISAGSQDSHNRIVIKVLMPEEDSDEARETLVQYMDAIIEPWDPDWLMAGTDDFISWQAREGPPRQVYVGWRTYLSNRIPIDVSVLDGRIRRTVRADGSQYLSLDGRPTEPSLDQALLFRRALGY